MSRPLDSLDQSAAGEALRQCHDEIDGDMLGDENAHEPWADVIGDDRNVFRRYARALEARGFEIVRRA